MAFRINDRQEATESEEYQVGYTETQAKSNNWSKLVNQWFYDISFFPIFQARKCDSEWENRLLELDSMKSLIKQIKRTSMTWALYIVPRLPLMNEGSCVIYLIYLFSTFNHNLRKMLAPSRAVYLLYSLVGVLSEDMDDIWILIPYYAKNNSAIDSCECPQNKCETDLFFPYNCQVFSLKSEETMKNKEKVRERKRDHVSKIPNWFNLKLCFFSLSILCLIKYNHVYS